jgi:hypothetical protein
MFLYQRCREHRSRGVRIVNAFAGNQRLAKALGFGFAALLLFLGFTAGDLWVDDRSSRDDATRTTPSVQAPLALLAKSLRPRFVSTARNGINATKN